MSDKAKLTRRDFLKWSGWGLTGAALSAFILKRELFRSMLPSIPMPLGHRLWTKNFPAPTEFEEVPAVIVGGGISGLSAAWYLTKHAPGIFYHVHELEPKAGGNSSWDENEVSAYPWGAHYVPFANEESEIVRDIFRDLGVISRMDGAKPFYNEDYVCHDPEERLLFRGQWTEGLIPNKGITEEESAEFRRFFALIEELKHKKGSDGRYLFAIPLALSSEDRATRALDKMSFATFLGERNFKSVPLQWYLDYCCKDDFGATTKDVSAWAGLHYFAARRGEAANGGNASLVTWPQGNGWIVEQLKARAKGFLFTQSLVYDVINEPERVRVRIYNSKNNTSKEISAKYAILATPLYVSAKIFADIQPTWEQHKKSFHHAPWLIANVTLSHKPGGEGFPLAWDNVSYYSPSIGYVVATHQKSSAGDGPTVLTFYHPYAHVDSSLKRHALLLESQTVFEDFVRRELAGMHPGIERHITDIKTRVWGHGMIRPSPGFMWNGPREKFAEPFGRVLLAHSDMSGISIFEEASYWGVNAAKYVKSQLDR